MRYKAIGVSSVAEKPAAHLASSVAFSIAGTAAHTIFVAALPPWEP